MIRLTVEQLYLLRDSIEASGQARTSVLPLEAMNTHRLIVAWAKTRTGDGLYLSIWKDAKAWAEAINKDAAGEPLPYDFINDQQSTEYTHAYPTVQIQGTPAEEVAYHIQRALSGGGTVDPSLYQKRMVSNRMTYEDRPSASDSGHPEFGTVRENE